MSFGYGRDRARWRRRCSAPVLRDVSLLVAPGTVAGLVGVNGAGKTTLLELAAGGLRPGSGTVSVFGRSLASSSGGRTARGRLGYCPDVPRLPRFLTGREALRLLGGLRGLSPGETRRRIRRLSERLSLRDVLDRRVGTISRGGLTRLGLAQALMDAPGLLLLDESFAHLDPVGQARLRRVVREERDRGAALLVSSHQLDQVERMADVLYVLHEGQLSGPFPRSGERPRSAEDLLLRTLRRSGMPPPG